MVLFKLVPCSCDIFCLRELARIVFNKVLVFGTISTELHDNIFTNLNTIT